MSDLNPPKVGSDGSLCYCSFCGKTQIELKKLIAGPGVYICNECVELCNNIMKEELKKKKKEPHDKFDTPKYLEALDTEQLNKQLLGMEKVRLSVSDRQLMVVDVLRARKVKWAEIGRLLGVSRQAVFQRFGSADGD